jgi:hypothetical protein
LGVVKKLVLFKRLITTSSLVRRGRIRLNLMAVTLTCGNEKNEKLGSVEI